MKFLVLPFTVLLIFFFSNCTYDNEEEFYTDVCDTLAVTYTETIEPVLELRCLGCHFNNNQQSGIELDDYQDVKQRVDDGSLLGSITHAPGFEPMPQGGMMLDECTIAQFRIWIEQGAPNN